MGLGVISPIRNKGLYSDWLSAAPLATSMLTIDTSGNVGSQAIPVAAWGSITGTLSSQTDLQNALNAKLSLSGGTLTGALSGTSATFSSYVYTTADAAATLPLRIRGAASQSANLTEWQSSTGGVWIRVTSNGTIRSATGDQYTPTISNASWGPGHGIIVNGAASCAFASNNDIVAQVNGSSGVFEFFRQMQVYVPGTGTFATITADTSDTLAFRRSTFAQRFNLYGTYTDASNYRRLYLSSTTAGAFTLGVEGAGTGASGNTLTVANATTFSGKITAPATGQWNTGGIGNDRNGIDFSDGILTYLNNAGSVLYPSYFTVGSGIPRLKLSSHTLLAWGASTDAGADKAFDSSLARNAVGQIDVRADSGLRVRNLANTSDAAITAGAGTFSGALRLPTNDTGIYFSASGNSSPRISVFANSLYIDANGSPGDINFRSTNSTHTNLKLYSGSNPVSAEFNSSISFGGTNCVITRDDADIIAFRRSTFAQRLNLYNTFTDASNYIRQSLSFTTYSSTVHAQLAAEGAGTGAVNIPFVITPRGTGAFIVGSMPDGTATGGNARGARAVDLQLEKTTASQVASGANSFVVGYANTASGQGSGAGGYNTSATGFGSFSWGNGCTTSGNYGITLGQSLSATGYASCAIGRENSATANSSFATGRMSTAWVQGMISFASGGRYSNPTQGDQQGGILPLLNWSAGASSVELLANATDRLTIPTRCSLGFVVEILGIKNKGGQAVFFNRQGIVKNVSGTTSIVGTVQTIGTDINSVSAAISITADDTNDSLTIACTQPTGEFTGATGVALTDIITLTGHPFVNGDEICFSSLSGGSGLSTNTKYFVRDVSGSTFKVTTSFVGNTAINFTTDITDATVDYIWYWHGIVRFSRINFGLY